MPVPPHSGVVASAAMMMYRVMPVSPYMHAGISAPPMMPVGFRFAPVAFCFCHIASLSAGVPGCRT